MTALKFLGKNHAAAYNALSDLVKQRGVVTLNEWREEVKSRGMNRSRFHETWKAMQKNGVIQVDQESNASILIESEEQAVYAVGRTREKSRPKGIKGNAPGDGWGVVGRTEGWVLYEKYDGNPNGWLNLKLVAANRSKHKANYWLAWNGERFASNKDIQFIKDHRRDLFEWLISELE